MSQISYRANLSAKSFPFNLFQSGRTVIVPGPDNTFNRSVSSAADVDRDVGIPQIIYGHNILPSQEGFNSVGFFPHITGYAITFVFAQTAVGDPPYRAGGSISTANNGFGLKTVWPINYNGNRAYLAFERSATDSYWWVNYPDPNILLSLPNNNINSWYRMAGDVLEGGTGPVCVFHWDDTPHMWLYNTATLQYELYNFQNPSTVQGPVAMTDDSPQASLMLTANGYVIQLENNAGLQIRWTLDISVWTPSLLTGAGIGEIREAKGAAKWAAPTSFGFIIYCEGNCVSAVFTGNSQYPFVYSEIRGSGGVIDAALVASDANSENQIAWTTSGLQSLGPKVATTFLPALSDFIKANIIQDFNTSTLAFSETVLTQPMNKKLTIVGGRYLVFSYGAYDATGKLDYAIVYDITLARFGKLKRTHYDCFDGQFRNSSGLLKETSGICFLNSSGYVNEVIPSITQSVVDATTPIDSCLMLGKYQYVRSRRLILDKVWVESLNQNNIANNQVIDYCSFNGKELQPGAVGFNYTPENVTAGIGQASYLFSKEGINHSLMFIGNWQFTSVQLDFHVGGKL